MSTDDDLYPCVGICMVDEASGLCQGCGRPVCEPASQAAAPPPTAPPPTAPTAPTAPASPGASAP